MAGNELRLQLSRKLRLRRRFRQIWERKMVNFSHNDAEMRLKNVKCYKCHKERHMARLCSESHMISLEGATDAPSEKVL